MFLAVLLISPSEAIREDNLRSIPRVVLAVIPFNYLNPSKWGYKRFFLASARHLPRKRYKINLSLLISRIATTLGNTQGAI